MKSKNRLITFLIVIAVGGAVYIGFGDRLRSLIFGPTDSSIPQQKASDEQLRNITTVAEKLDTPWSIAVLPNMQVLVTERAGTVSIIGSDGVRITIADVVERGEGGLLGLTLHPKFKDNSQLYVYKTTGENNVVERYRLENKALVERRVIVADIPAANVHNGGEVRFGPDNKLYITTGDAADESQAQDKNSLAGKILRINDDGTVPSDNPFATRVWSYGHRNPQGLAWDDRGRLWSTEHGPSGSESGFDELNLIEKGGNYGWPDIRGDVKRDGFVAPVAQSGASETWAPAGLAYAEGSLYFTGLRGQTLYEAKINGNTVSLTSHFATKYGRLRAVTVSDQALFVSTSNRDGRGSPGEQDDRILRIPLQVL